MFLTAGLWDFSRFFQSWKSDLSFFLPPCLLRSGCGEASVIALPRQPPHTTYTHTHTHTHTCRWSFRVQRCVWEGTPNSKTPSFQARAAEFLTREKPIKYSCSVAKKRRRFNIYQQVLWAGALMRSEQHEEENRARWQERFLGKFNRIMFQGPRFSSWSKSARCRRGNPQQEDQLALKSVWLSMNGGKHNAKSSKTLERTSDDE